MPEIPPRVSIIVPNFNHARFLHERLGSIGGQSFGDFEVILMDDASTDDSRGILDAWSAGWPRVKTVYNRTNSGSPFVQWNRGVGLATGEFVWIAESDDAAEPDLLQTLVGLLESCPDAALAMCDSVLVGPDGKPSWRWSESRPVETRGQFATDFTMAGNEFIARFMFQDCYVSNASCVVFRRSAFVAAGGADESFRFCGDYATWVRVLRHGGLAYCSRPLNRWRRHDASFASRTILGDGSIADTYRVAGEIRRRCAIERVALERRFGELMSLWFREYDTPRGDGGRRAKAALLRAGFAADPRFVRRLAGTILERRYDRSVVARTIVHALARAGVKW